MAKTRERIIATTKKTKGFRGLINKAINKAKIAEQQYETPIKQAITSPSNTQGTDGDRLIVTEKDGNYLYIKVSGRWMKTQLQEVD